MKNKPNLPSSSILAFNRLKVQPLFFFFNNFFHIEQIKDSNHFQSQKAISEYNRDYNAFKKDLAIFKISSKNISIYHNGRLSEEEYYSLFTVLFLIVAMELFKELPDPNKKDTYSNYEIQKYNLKEIAIILYAIKQAIKLFKIKDLPDEWNYYYQLEQKIAFNSISEITDNLQHLIQENSKDKDNILNISLLKNPTVYCKNSTNLYSGTYSGFGFFITEKAYTSDYSKRFVEAIVQEAQKKLREHANKNLTEEQLKERNKESYKAKEWFQLHYPMLSNLAMQFSIVEDIQFCHKYDIQIGAVSVNDKTIFINPLANLTPAELRFVIAHEILHVALCHQSRQGDRNHFWWNLACDFVINDWLVDMGVGVPPEGIFLDISLKGKSAEEIYHLIESDVKLQNSMCTLGDMGKSKKKKQGDMLDSNNVYYSDFEDACKEALLRGLELHESSGRGTLPAELIEEIRKLNQPAIPWQAKLADWISERILLDENKRSYARPSRRQGSTPDIPKPSYNKKQEDDIPLKTLGVIIDTSGSMSNSLLAKCLGAISSFSAANGIKYIRLVYCDAQPYDEGFVHVEQFENTLKVKGRGGTVIQPAVNYLLNTKDFPKDAPILIMTDGDCEPSLTIGREHAFLIPKGRRLPFMSKGSVFEFK